MSEFKLKMSFFPSFFWFLFVFPQIVDPSCTKDAPNRTKDHIVTRSFKDNK